MGARTETPAVEHGLPLRRGRVAQNSPDNTAAERLEGVSSTLGKGAGRRGSGRSAERETLWARQYSYLRCGSVGAGVGARA